MILNFLALLKLATVSRQEQLPRQVGNVVVLLFESLLDLKN